MWHCPSKTCRISFISSWNTKEIAWVNKLFGRFMIYGTGNRSCLIYLGFKREASWTVGRLARFLGRALCCTGQLCSLLPTNEKIEHQKIEMVLYVFIKLARITQSSSDTNHILFWCAKKQFWYRTCSFSQTKVRTLLILKQPPKLFVMFANQKTSFD